MDLPSIYLLTVDLSHPPDHLLLVLAVCVQAWPGQVPESVVAKNGGGVNTLGHGLKYRSEKSEI